MKDIIKITFSDFWIGFDPNDNYFINLLRKKFNVELSDNRDYLIYSVFSNNHLKYNCVKILFTGENVKPNYLECDFSISFDYKMYHGRNIRYPLFNCYDDISKLLEKKDPQKILEGKSKFCNMVVSNGNAKERIDFFHILNKFKKVDSGGRFLNNIGSPIENKREFLRDYKFTLAFENASALGYTTEKIFEPMLENSVPIYWGNPNIETDFNKASFINVLDFKSFEEAVEYILFIDNNDDEYYKILSQPWLPENKLNSYHLEENLINFLREIFEKHEHSYIKGNVKKILRSILIMKDKVKYNFFNEAKLNT